MSNWSPQLAVHALICFETSSAFFLKLVAYPLTVFETSRTFVLPSTETWLDLVLAMDTQKSFQISQTSEGVALVGNTGSVFDYHSYM